MGWASGSSIAEGVWQAAKKHLKTPRDQYEFAEKLIELFEEHDCDTLAGETTFYDIVMGYDEKKDKEFKRPKPPK